MRSSISISAPRRLSWTRPLALTVGLALAACSPDPASLGAGDAAASAPGPKRPDPISVSVAPVVRDRMESVYATSGSLRAERRAMVAARTRGVLEDLFVEEGDVVIAGQPLAQLENDEQELAFDRATQAHTIKAREFERSRELNVDDLISDAELDLLARDLEDVKADLEMARLNLNRTVIIAPFDGIVVARMLDLGATVADGTDLFELADVEPLYLDVSVPERHVGRLAPGQVVQLFADAAGVSAEARIERLSPVVDTTTGTVKVTVAVDDAVALRPGAFVEVEVVTDVHENTLVVPRSALVTEGRRWLVFKVGEGADVAAQALEVTLGFDRGERVEIAGVVSGGPLLPGDRVVVRGASALSDGAPLRIVDEEQADTVADEIGTKPSSAASGG